MTIGIYIYDNAEVLDFSGPFEVFSTASRVCEDASPFDVFLIGETGSTVHARAGYKVCPNYGSHNHPDLDVLIVVGGDCRQEMNKPKVHAWIAEQSHKASLVASVCTGAFLLAQSGVLTTEKVTTHWSDISSLKEQFSQLTVIENVRWVDEDRIVTSGGISAGIDMSLHLVSRLHSEALALSTAKQMEFAWTRSAGSTRS